MSAFLLFWSPAVTPTSPLQIYKSQISFFLLYSGEPLEQIQPSKTILFEWKSGPDRLKASNPRLSDPAELRQSGEIKGNGGV